MNYFDLHCDTAFDMYHKKCGLAENSLAVSLKGFEKYEKKAQVFAIWSDNKKSPDENYADFFSIFDNLKQEVEENCEKAVFCTNSAALSDGDTRLKIIPAVEGSALLGKDISRLEILREYGVRILTLTWGGICEVGGAHDTKEGLSDFGFKVVEACEKLGIIIDVSHLSEKGFWDLANIATKPFIASHSNSADICIHTRNLSDTQLRTIVTSGGITGVNLVKHHLSKAFVDNLEVDCDLACEAVIKHIVHFMEKGSANSVCIGTDLDGTAPIIGLDKVEYIYKIGEKMKNQGAPDSMINDIFYNNAYNFFIKNL